MKNTPEYNTLEEIRQRKAELLKAIDHDNEHIIRLWGQVFVKRDEVSRGEYISNIISNSALAIDAFLMFRKLRKNYKNYSGLFKKKKRR